MDKTCLIIDNDDQTSEIEKLERDGKARGINMECHQFNVGSTFDDELLTEGKIDIDKVVSAYKKRFKNKSFHLVAFDWDLSDDKINGIELMRLLSHKKVLRHTPKILYTGLLEDKLSGMLDEYKANNITKDVILVRLKTLIKADIRDFVARENYEQDILRVISEIGEPLDLIIEEELKKMPGARFKSSFVSSSFSGKTFSELSEILEEDIGLRNKFQKEMVQQVIAYLSELS